MRKIKNYNRYLLERNHYIELDIHKKVYEDNIAAIKEYINNGIKIDNRYIIDVKSKDMLIVLLKNGLSLENNSYNIRDIINTLDKNDIEDLLKHDVNLEFDNNYLSRLNIK